MKVLIIGTPLQHRDTIVNIFKRGGINLLNVESGGTTDTKCKG